MGGGAAECQDLQPSDGCADQLSGQVLPGTVRDHGVLVQLRQTEGVGSGDLDERGDRGQERVQADLDPSQDGVISVRVLNPAMGVPISFLDKYCPEQFEIVGATESEGSGFSQGLYNGGHVKQATVDGKRVYKRIFIRYI